jgi:hypothetical protein
VALFQNCPECEGNDWATPVFQSDIRCKRCGLEIDPEEVKKEPKSIFNDIVSDEPKVSSQKNREYSDDLRSRVNDKKTEGWEVLEYKSDHVVMGKQKKAGLVRHFVTFLLTAPLTLGMGNAAYHEYKKRQYEKTVLREKEEPDPREETPSEALESLEELREDGLISDTEYEAKRKEILERL